MLFDKTFVLHIFFPSFLFISRFLSKTNFNFWDSMVILFLSFSIFINFSALLAGTLRTYQKAGCDAEYMSLSCPRGTQISIELAQYGNSLKGTFKSLNFIRRTTDETRFLMVHRSWKQFTSHFQSFPVEMARFSSLVFATRDVNLLA